MIEGVNIPALVMGTITGASAGAFITAWFARRKEAAITGKTTSETGKIELETEISGTAHYKKLWEDSTAELEKHQQKIADCTSKMAAMALELIELQKENQRLLTKQSILLVELELLNNNK